MVGALSYTIPINGKVKTMWTHNASGAIIERLVSHENGQVQFELDDKIVTVPETEFFLSVTEVDQSTLTIEDYSKADADAADNDTQAGE